MSEVGLRLEVSDGVAHLRLDRPPGNRISWRLLCALRDAVEGLHRAPDLRAAVLSAEGEDFSQGADLRDPELARVLRTDGGREMARVGQALVDAWARLPVPTVAAGRGFIVGAGACLFLTADLRFAPPEARVRLPEVDRGMHLAWGVIPRLVRELGLPDARWLTLTGEPLEIRALRPGVVRATEAPEEAARAFAASMARRAPLALRAVKATLVAAAEGDPHAPDADVERFARTVESADFGEALAAFFERRPPRFRGA